MNNLTSLFVRANGTIVAHPTSEEFHLDEIDHPFSFFQDRLDPSLTHYDHIACDLTDSCNLRCPFCINDFADASSVRMDGAHFAKVLELAPLANDESVFISCLWEPLLHPQLLDLLGMIPKTIRNQFFLTTNLSTKRLGETFLAGLAALEVHHINVSVDSLQKQIFEKMRMNAKFSVFIENLENAARIFAQNADSPEFRFITLAARSNLPEIPTLVKNAHERYHVDFHEIRYPFDEGTPEGIWKEENLLRDDEWIALVDRITPLPYWTHVSRGSSLLRCGFGRKEPASATWGPRDVPIDNIASQWYLPLMARLYPAWRSLRNVARRRLGLPYSGPAIEVAVATASYDRMVRIPTRQGIGAFAITAANLGRTGLVTVIPKVPEDLGIVATICPTQPKTGTCLEAAKPSLTIESEHSSTATFTVFVRRRGRSASKSLNARVEVLFLNHHGQLCGATCVGVQTQESDIKK